MDDNKSLLQYLGCGVIVLTVIYITFKLLKYYTTILEGMSDSSDSSDSVAPNSSPQQIAQFIKNMTDNKLDELAIDNNRQEYEDIIINLQELVDVSALHLIVKSTNKDGNHVLSQAFTDNLQAGFHAFLINALFNFKHTLTKSMQYLDSTASGGIMG